MLVALHCVRKHEFSHGSAQPVEAALCSQDHLFLPDTKEISELKQEHSRLCGISLDHSSVNEHVCSVNMLAL